MQQKDILDEIIARKRQDLATWMEEQPLADLERRLDGTPASFSLSRNLKGSPTGIIAEFKRRSPSKGWFNRAADPCLVPAAYERAGAAALSILADTPYFGGSVDDIRLARPTVSLPILCKDFIVSRYQLVRAKLAQADAVLLIAAALTTAECRELARAAHELGLEVLLELHREEELDYVDDDIDVVGVNNRDLGTFHTDVARSLELAGRLPEDRPRVSESGISHPEALTALRRAGFDGFLIGEAFMHSADPGEALSRFIRETL